MKRLLAALFVGPAIVLAILFLAAHWLLNPSLGPVPEILVILAVPLAYCSVLLFGAPLLIVAWRRRWLSWRSFLLGGGLVALPAAVATAFSEPGGTIQALNGAAIPTTCIASGVLAGLLVWVIGVHTR
jgi:hypothetical protein